MQDIFQPIFEGAARGHPCRWPLDADASHEFILIDDAAEAMLKLVATPAAHGRAVHDPGPRPITPGEFIRLAYASAGWGGPRILELGRGKFRFVALCNRSARSPYAMSYLCTDPVLLV